MNKRFLAILLSLLMIMTMLPVSALASDFNDMPNDWSATALENAVKNGLLKGDNGKLRPKDNLTRAQMATVLNRAFGVKEKADLSNYTDVPTNAWYYADMAKAVQMKTFMGNNNKLNPSSNITREEVFLVLSRAFKLANASENALNKFSDKNSVSSWAEDGVASLVEAGYIAGSNGKLNPKQNITRAEFAQVMDNILKHYINDSDTYTEDLDGNVMINVPDVTLKDMTIIGDLVIGDGVGNGDVILDSVNVRGRTVIRGGGVNSIKIIGNSNIKNMIIARVDGQVRVYAKDGTEIGDVEVDGNDNVIIEGDVGNVVVTAPDIIVTATNAEIVSATIEGENSIITLSTNSTMETATVDAENAEIRVLKGSEIEDIVINSDGAKITGKGNVGTVLANADNIAVSTPGTEVTADSETTGVTAGTKTVDPGSTTTTTTRKSHSSADTTAPTGYSVSIDQSSINNSNKSALSFTFANAEVGATYNYSIDDTNGGTSEVTGSGTISTATDQISNIDVSGLDDDTLTLTVYLTDKKGNQGNEVTDIITIDTTAPSNASGYPKVDTATGTGFTVRAKTNESGIAYYVVVDDGASAPTASEIQAGTASGGGAALKSGNIALTANTEGSSAVAGLSEVTAYDIYVVAKDSSNNVQSSVTKVEITTLDATAPTAGGGGTLSTSSVTSNSLTVNWTKSTDNGSAQSNLEYLVYYSTSNNIDTVANMESNGTAVGSYTADINTKEITGLSDFTTYYFNVIVKDETGNKTAYTTVSQATTDGTAPTAGNSGALSTSNVTSNSLTVSWTKSTDNGSAQSNLEYLVYYSTTNNIDTVAKMESNGTAVGSYTADISTIVITGLSDLTSYYFNVIVRDEAGNKTAYRTVSEATTDGTGPTAGGSGSLSTSGVGTSSVTVNWTEATDSVTPQFVLEYLVYYSTSNNIDTVENMESNGTAFGSYTFGIRTKEITGLSEATTYYFNVIVKDDAGNKTAYTTVSQATKDATAPTGYSVSLDQSYANSSTETGMSFTFAGAEVGATYNYSIDDTNGATSAIIGSGTISSTTQQISGIDVSSLSDDTLILTVYLTDAAGNQGVNQIDTAIKDTSAPNGYSVSIDQSYANSTTETGMSFTFAGAQVGATFNYSIDDTNGGTSAITGSGTISSTTQQISGIDVSSLSDDTLILTVYLTDVAGNQGGNQTDTAIKDTSAPNGYSVSIDQSYANSTTETGMSFTFAGAQVGATFNYSIDDTNGGTSAITGSNTVSSATETISGINVSSLSDDTLILTVYLTDAAGNQGGNQTDTATKDTSAPTVTITSAESGTTSNSPFSVTITFNEDVAGFTVGDISVGNGTVENLVNTTPNRVWTAGIMPSADGAVTVGVNAGVCTDTAGNNNTAATQFSITYSSGGLPASPIMLWKFENNGNDEQGNYNLDSSSGASFSSGIVKDGNYSLDLTAGSGSFMYNSGLQSFIPSGNALSIATWVYIPSNPNGVVSLFEWCSGARFGILLDNTAKVYGAVRLSPDAYITSNNSINIGAWNHIVFTWDGTTANLYINGVEDESSDSASGSGNNIAAAPYNNNNFWVIGNNALNQSSGFNGYLDEVLIYDRALTLEEVTQIYNFY